MNKCRNCGRSELKDLGPIGRIAAFFLKRVFAIELISARSSSPLRQMIRRLGELFMSVISRQQNMDAYVEIQICENCSFIQTKIPFHEEDIMRLYVDYRESSYNRERIQYEPTYASIATAVGNNEVEIRTRTAALNTFLHSSLPSVDDRFTMLDYGGSDGRFMPDLPGTKFIYDVSKIDPLPGIIRISHESKLGMYSLVLLSHVIEHLVNPLNLVRTLHSHVEPGGYIYIETPQEISDQQRSGLLTGTLKMQMSIHEHINSYCIPAVSGVLEAAGFTVIAIECKPIDIGWAKPLFVRALGRKKPMNESQDAK